MLRDQNLVVHFEIIFDKLSINKKKRHNFLKVKVCFAIRKNNNLNEYLRVKKKV